MSVAIADERRSLPRPETAFEAAASVKRWPQVPCLIEPLPRSLVAYDDLDALADRVALLLQGRGYDLITGHAALPGYDTFPKVTVMARGLTKAQAEWLGAAVLLSPGGRLEDIGRLDAALEAALRRRG